MQIRSAIDHMQPPRLEQEVRHVSTRLDEAGG